MGVSFSMNGVSHAMGSQTAKRSAKTFGDKDFIDAPIHSCRVPGMFPDILSNCRPTEKIPLAKNL